MAGTAIFDLDRTITKQPTWTRFCFYANRDRLGFWLRLPLWMGRGVALKLGLADRQAYKRYSLYLLSAMPRDVIEAKAQSFAMRDVARGLRPGTAAAIAHHRARGDRLIMASACCEFLADKYGALLGFDEVIGTELAWSGGTTPPPPRMEGENCYGAEKARRLAACHDAKPFARPIYAYSDHVSDLEMLTKADYGFAVNPSRKLREVSKPNGVSVVDFDLAELPAELIE